MAVWLVRVLHGGDPPPPSLGGLGPRFGDVGSDHRYGSFIERLAVAGVTTGCSVEPLLYCGDDYVTREQMASFLVRAFKLHPAEPAGFVDVSPGGVHSADIDALHAAGVTTGCSVDPLLFCGDDYVTREQMASFLARAVRFAPPVVSTSTSASSTTLAVRSPPPTTAPVPVQKPAPATLPPVVYRAPTTSQPPATSQPPTTTIPPLLPTLTVVPPEEDKEDEVLLQTAAGTPEVVRAITDKSVHNANFQVYYRLAGTIVDPDGQTLSWNVIKPPEADWLVFDLAALTLSGRVPSSFAEGDSVTITVKAIDTDAKAAEYSFSITSLGAYNPEPLGCRATGAPIATKSWIKIGNWEWAEPDHNPAIPRNTPGYWQPNWVETLSGAGKPKWSAPYIIKPSRRVAGQAERWRMKEVEYYRITRSPAWDFGQLIVDIDNLQGFYGPDGNEVAITVVKGRDIAPTSTDPRTDGLWTYTLTDYEQDSTAPGYIYTIEASTCENGPWSQPLELQWRLPSAPKIHEHRTRLTNLDEDGHLLSDGQLALKIGWAFERGQVYNIDIEVSDPDNPGDFLKGVGRSLPHTQSDLSGGQWQVLIERAFIPEADAFHNLDGSGRQVRVRMRVLLTVPKTVEGPWTDWLYLTASEEEVAND